MKDLKEKLIKLGISLSTIALIIGGVLYFNGDEKEIRYVKFDNVKISIGADGQQYADENELMAIIDKWIMEDEPTKKEYKDIYDEYKRIKNLDENDCSLTQEESEFKFIVYNTKLGEIRENCKEDIRCNIFIYDKKGRLIKIDGESIK